MPAFRFRANICRKHFIKGSFWKTDNHEISLTVFFSDTNPDGTAFVVFFTISGVHVVCTENI